MAAGQESRSQAGQGLALSLTTNHGISPHALSSLDNIHCNLKSIIKYPDDNSTCYRAIFFSTWMPNAHFQQTELYRARHGRPIFQLVLPAFTNKGLAWLSPNIAHANSPRPRASACAEDPGVTDMARAPFKCSHCPTLCSNKFLITDLSQYCQLFTRFRNPWRIKAKR